MQKTKKALAKSRGMDIYIALVHYPVLNRSGDKVTTSVTNLDIHDIARVARTYDLKAYWLVHPIAQQRDLIERIVQHWRSGEGREHNAVRAESFDRVRVSVSVDALVSTIEKERGERPQIIATGASFDRSALTWEQARSQLLDPEQRGAMLILFGTGWGLHDELLRECDTRLPAIKSVREDTYNHLSVRSAVSIAMDRLLGER